MKSMRLKIEIVVDTLMLSSSIVLFVVNKIDATVEVDRGMWNESISSNVFGGGYPQSLICGERYFDQNLYYDLRDASDSLDIITSRLQFTIMEI